MSDAVARSDLNAVELSADERRERRTSELLSLPAVLLVTGLVVIPVGWLFYLSFVGEGGYTIANYSRMWSNLSYIEVFKVTFLSSAIVTLLCIVLGYPVAYLMSRVSARLTALILIAVLMPFWTSVLVRTYAWLVLLQRRGLVNTTLIQLGLIESPLPLVNNLVGTVVGMLHVMLPFMILPLYATMRAIDFSLVRAAQSLGATPISAFWKVFFPLSLPGLMAGAALVFIMCLGFYVTPELLGGGRVITVPMKIRENTSAYIDWGAASALGAVLLALTAVILGIASRLAASSMPTGKRR